MANVRISHAAAKALKRLPRDQRRRIADAIDLLASENRGDVRPLQAVAPPIFRLRVGDWRVKFPRHGEDIDIVAIDPRGGAY